MSATHYHYSPELWPGNTSLPVPSVRRYQRLEISEGGWIYSLGETREFEVPDEAQPPAEMHLREFRDCAVTSPESLRDLMLVVGFFDTLAGLGPDEAELSKLSYRRVVHSIASQLDFPQPDFTKEGDPARFALDAIHVAEVAYMVDRVCALSEHVENALQARATAPVWQKRGLSDETDDRRMLHDSYAPPGSGRRPFSEEDPEWVAWKRFADLINQGLSSLSPRVAPPPDFDSEPDFSHIKDPWVAACVMIFNDLAEGIPYKRCADETCGRTFRFQLGRAATGQKRGARTRGVAYCSPEHARRQSQRDRRRAERAQQSNPTPDA